MSTPKHVLVVGTGIVGASIALHLLRAGARVTMIDSRVFGGVATRNSWAWINASAGNPHRYFSLRVRAMQEWRELERAVPGLSVAWVGGLTWELPEERLRQFVAEHAGWGYDIRLLDRDAVAALESGLARPPALAAHAPGEGVVEPADAVRAILAEVERLGGRLVANMPARSFDLRDGRACGVITSDGPIAADEIVVAAGVGSVRLLATAGYALPLSASTSLLAISRPQGHMMHRPLVTPTAEIRQTAAGRVIACAALPDMRTVPQAAFTLYDEVHRLFMPASPIVWERSVVVNRPMPDDRLPLLGRIAGLEGLYVATTHSGITLAPIIGRFVAEEILTGQRDALLAPFGLDRFGARPR